jgi:hypothetical protein
MAGFSSPKTENAGGGSRGKSEGLARQDKPLVSDTKRKALPGQAELFLYPIYIEYQV